MDVSICQNCVSVFKCRKMKQREWWYGINVNFKRKRGNIISYVDCSKDFHVIRYFPYLNQEFGKEDINVPLSSSSRSIEWRKIHMSQSEQYVDQIDTSM